MPPYMYQVDSDRINNTINTLRDSPWNDVTTASSWRELGANMALKDVEFQHNLDMWNRQNEYNTPAAQMQRFAAAGLNPNLIYSQGNPGNATSAPQYQAPTYSKDADFKKLNSVLSVLGTVNQFMSTISGIVDSGMDLRLKSNQVKESDMYMSELEKLYNGIKDSHPSDYNIYDPFWSYIKPSGYNAFMNSNFKGQLLPYQMQAMDAVTKGRNYQNNFIMPLIRDFNQGKVDLQGLSKDLMTYQRDLLGTMDPSMRQLYMIFMDIFRNIPK